jgi:hypothetical protein
MIEQVFQNRVAMVREQIIGALDLDMLLAYSDDPLAAGAVRYLTDFDVYAMYAIVVLPSRGDVALAFGLHHSAYLVRVKEAAKADYYLGTYQPGDLCARLLHDSGCCRPAPRIGLVGSSSMFRKIEEDLLKALPQATFMDLDAEFWDLLGRDIGPGSTETLARLHRSAQISSEALRAGQDQWLAGRSGSEIAATAGLVARRRGADILNREMVHVALATGLPLPPFLNPGPSHVPRARQALAIEVRAAYRGANTRLARTVSNPGDGELADEIASVRNQHRSVCATLRSGMSVEEVFRAIETLQHSLDSIDSDDGIEGHGIGFSAFLEPELRRGTQAVLPQTGAFVIDTKRHHSRLGTIRFADTLLVTKAGAHNLTDKQDARELSS